MTPFKNPFSRTARPTARRRPHADVEPAPLERRVMLATFVVNTTSDAITTVDETDGLVSLREAIIAANTNQAFGDAQAGDADGDVIVFEGGLFGAFGLFANDRTIDLVAELEVTDDLVIETPRTFFTITLDGGGSNRIVNINADDETVVLSDITLANGSADSGGAVLAQSDLTLDTVTVRDSFANEGAGLANDGANVRIVESAFFGNRAATNGGAIATSDGGSLDIDASVFTQNSAGMFGGAIASTFSQIEIDASTFLFNLAGSFADETGSGGAIDTFDSTDLDVADSLFLFNAAGAFGGAITISNGSVLDLDRTTIAFSAVPLFAEEGSFVGVGGAILNVTFADIDEESLIFFNLARDGGGIFTGADGETQFVDTSDTSNVFLNLLNNLGGNGPIVEGTA